MLTETELRDLEAHCIWEPTLKQNIFLSCDFDEVLYGGSAGGGKELSLKTQLVTPSGLVPMGDIEVGSLVVSEDGTPTKVLAISEIESPLDSYEIEFDTGEIVQACGRHKWKTLTDIERGEVLKHSPEWRKKRRDGRKSRAVEVLQKPWVSKSITQINRDKIHEYKSIPEGTIRTTKEILDTLHDRKIRVNHSIELCAPVKGDEKDLPIAPYLFGLWLGDGFSSGGVIGMLKDDFDEILSDNKFDVLSNTLSGKERIYPFSSIRFTGLTRKLRDSELIRNKHIPNDYLRASIDQRIALLQGMMDTDGTCNKRGQCELGFSNKTLTESAFQLISSLGIKTTITKKTLKNPNHKDHYRVKFMAPFPVFRLKRKLERQKLAGFRPTVTRRYIVAVRKIAPVPMRCIQVAHPSGMYLITASHIPTHNSDGLLIDALGIHQEAILWDRYKAIIFRKTMPELGELIDRSRQIYPFFYPGAVYNKTNHVWQFPSGAQIILGFLEKDDDRFKYQGHSYQYVGWDELTHWATPVPYLFLRSRTRSVNRPGKPRIKCYTRATTNPGGRGHSWVKQWWNIQNDGSPTAFIKRFRNPIPDEDGKFEDADSSRCFIPSRLSDNPHLANTGYREMLISQSEHDKKRLLDGRWDITDGQFFDNWDPITDVVKPFEIPVDWPRWRAMDWGYARPYSVGWYTINPDGVIFRYKELYGWGGAADVGTKESAGMVAEKILARDESERKRGATFRNNVADHNIWHSRGEQVVISELINNKLKNANAGVFAPSKGGKGSRVNGWGVCNEILHARKFKVFEGCVHFIRTVPNLLRDPNNPEDVDTEMEDHVGDEWRYSLTSRGHKFKDIEEKVNKAPYMSFDYICEMEEDKPKVSRYRLYESTY